MKDAIEAGKSIASGEYSGYWILVVVLLVQTVVFGWFIFFLVKNFIGNKLDKLIENDAKQEQNFALLDHRVKQLEKVNN